MNSGRHENYDILNLIGYGLSKFDTDFVSFYGFSSKQKFYKYIVGLGIAETTGVVKNRQDLFDGMEPGGKRKGWWQKGDVYKFRRDYIDSLFGNLGVKDFVDIVKMTVSDKFGARVAEQKLAKKQSPLSFTELSRGENEVKPRPIIQSCFKQMQITGHEAEYYFFNNYQAIAKFAEAKIEDARLFGDGYDFQLSLPNQYYLAEVKGVREKTGQIRMTQKEYDKAKEYGNDYALVVVANLSDVPWFVPIFNPLAELQFEKHNQPYDQIFYCSSI